MSEQKWKYDIKYGPEGEASYAWVYSGKQMVATMRTYHAKEICDAMNAAPESAPADEPTPKARDWVDDEKEILKRLADGDTIVFSQDGDMAWFTKGDRAFVGDAIMSLRAKGYLSRECDDEENYRGLSEYDTISDAGRAALTGGGNG